MKFKPLFTLILAGATMAVSAQTHTQGVEYFRADQFDNAQELLNRNMNNAGTDQSLSNYYLGEISLSKGLVAEAQNYFDKGVQLNVECPFNYVGLGSIALKNNDLKGAQNQFKLADKYAKKDASVAVAIAEAYYNADPVAYEKEVDKYITKARKQNLQDPDIYIFEGNMRKDRKDIGGAAAQYEMAAGYDPTDAAAYVKYAKLFRDVNPKYGVQKLQELLRQNPQSALGQRELANYYYDMGDYAKAASEYEKYVKNPNHFKQDEDRYAFLLFYSNRYKDGYDYASQLLAANPQNFTAMRYQFMNAAQLKDMDSQLLEMAEKLYQAHKVNPKDNKFAPIDYLLIADEMSKAKRPEEAEMVLREAIKENPDNASFNKQLATIYIEENQIAKAAEAFEGYISKLEKPSVNDYVQQATYSFYASVEKKDDPALVQKYLDDTVKYSELAAAENPTFYKPKKTLGDVAKQRAATEEESKAAATPMYLEAVQLLEAAPDPSRYNSDAKEMYVYLGNYYLDQKDTESAKTFFNKYLQLAPNDETFRKFVDGLK